MKPSEKLYLKYEYLAKRYANRIFSYEELSFEYEDLLQEFKVKIFTSIKAYGKRWLFYRNNGYNKPVPLQFYLETACKNLAKDFMKYISNENHKFRIDSMNYDFGYEPIDTVAEPSGWKYVVNGIDLLEGLHGKERFVFAAHLQGYPKEKIAIVYSNKTVNKEDLLITTDEIINKQSNYLICRYGSELKRRANKYESYQIEKD